MVDLDSIFDPRSEHAQEVDKGKRAPRTADEEKWAQDRDGLDLKGWDTPESRSSGSASRPLSSHLKVKKEDDGAKLFGRTFNEEKGEEETLMEEFGTKKEAEERARQLTDDDMGLERIDFEDEEGNSQDSVLFGSSPGDL